MSSTDKISMYSPVETAEILVELAFLAQPDEFVLPNPHPSDLVETLFELFPDGIPDLETGEAVFQSLNLFDAGAIALDLYYDDENMNAFIQKIVNSPALQRTVVEVLDEELKVVYPNYVDASYTFGDKATAVAKGRFRATKARLDARRIGTEPRKFFKVILNNFERDRKSEFLRDNNLLHIYLDDTFSHFQEALRIGTVCRRIPPPPAAPDFLRLMVMGKTLPDPKDDAGDEATGDTGSVKSDSESSIGTQSTWDESTERPSLEYSEGVLSRTKMEGGYDLSDGPWIYRIRKRDGINYGPQRLLNGLDDYKEMIKIFKSIVKRYPDAELMIKMIHSQDRVGRAKWMAQTRKDDIEIVAIKKKKSEETKSEAELQLEAAGFGPWYDLVPGLYEYCQ